MELEQEDKAVRAITQRSDADIQKTIARLQAELEKRKSTQIPKANMSMSSMFAVSSLSALSDRPRLFADEADDTDENKTADVEPVISKKSVSATTPTTGKKSTSANANIANKSQQPESKQTQAKQTNQKAEAPKVSASKRRRNRKKGTAGSSSTVSTTTSTPTAQPTSGVKSFFKSIIGRK
jgi:hypothetical protein